MSTIKRFTVLPNDLEPLQFELIDAEDPPNVIGVFSVTRRPRLDLALGLGRAVILNNGKREIDQGTMLYVVRELLVRERKNAEGVWEPADDVERFDALLASDRINLNWDLLTEVVMWLTEELSGHPTGASSLS